MTTETAPHPARRHVFSLLWGLLWRPRRTLDTISASGGRAWLLVALLIMLSAVLPVVVAAPINARSAQQTIQTQLDQQQDQGQEISPEMQRNASQFTTNPLFTLVFPSLAVLIGLWLGWLIWSGALHLLSTMLGGSNRFDQVWRVVVWSWLPYLLRGLLQTAFILATGAVIAQPGLSGFAAADQPVEQLLAPPGAGQLAWQAFLAQIDLFLVWNLALLMVGLAAAARFARRKALWIVLLVWALLALFRLIPALLPGVLAGGM